MKSTIFLAFGLLIGIFASACSSSSDAAKTVSGQNSNSAKPAVTGQNTDPNAAVNTGQPANVRGGRNFANKKMIIDPSATPPPMQFHPADENSEWGVAMNGDGSVLEVRTFKNHPRFTKVEARSFGTNDKQVKFYLRSGQVVEVRTDRLTNLKTMTTAELLAIAGLK